MKGPPLKMTHRQFDPASGTWRVVDGLRWWTSKTLGDIWITDRTMSIRTIEINPDQFVPPAEFR